MTTSTPTSCRPATSFSTTVTTTVITDVERRDGWAWPVAADGTGWAIALGHRLVCVERLTRSMRSPATQAALAAPARTAFATQAGLAPRRSHQKSALAEPSVRPPATRVSDVQ